MTSDSSGRFCVRRALRSAAWAALCALCLACASAGCGAAGARSFVEPACRLTLDWAVPLYALDFMAWKPRDNGQAAAGPDGTILSASRSGGVRAVEAETGQLRWQFEVLERVEGAPLLDGDAVYFGVTSGHVFKLDAATGKPSWPDPVKVRGAVRASPALANGRVIVQTELGRLVAIGAGNAQVLWDLERAKPAELGLLAEAGPVAAGSTVYAGFFDGTVQALTADDGTVLWSRNVAGEGKKYPEITGTPAIAGKLLLVPCAATGLHALDLETGQPRWVHAADSAGAATPQGDVAYVSLASGEVRGLSLSDGKTLWRTRLTGSAPSVPVVAGPSLLVSAGKNMALLDRRTGVVLERVGTEHGFSARPLWDGQRAYLVSNGGLLHALQLR
jgi:outer membrane protein assembly factor BamB